MVIVLGTYDLPSVWSVLRTILHNNKHETADKHVKWDW